MVNKTILNTDLAPKAVGTYSQGAKVNGIYYFSGQIGLHPQTNEMAQGVEAQVAQILKNVDGLLESQNLTRENIFKTTIFLCDLKDFDFVNKAYVEYFKEPYPARSCVEVKALPKGALVEIEVLAHEN